MRAKNSWEWAACGKHPAAKDYFQFNVKTGLMSAFSEWVENGYQGFVTRNKKTYNSSAWRFWARGIKQDDLICGVLKDSSDSIGRPYPLLIMGHGTVKRWQANWVSLFLVLKKLLDQIEYISARRFDGLNQLEIEIDALPLPTGKWLEGVTPQQTVSIEDHRFSPKALQLEETKKLWVSLNDDSQLDPFATAEAWSISLARRGYETPNALFVGGNPDQHYLAVFQRSLNVRDFDRLWSIAEEGRS